MDSCPWPVHLQRIARDSLYFTRQQLEETTQYETRAARPTPRLLPRLQGLLFFFSSSKEH